MKIGILGSGMIVPNHAETVKALEGLQDVAICCVPAEIERATKIATDYNIEYIYTDYDEMLGNTEIDAIYIAVPNHLHYEMSLLAIRAGKFVICEKPFTSTTKEAEHLFEEAKKYQVMIWEAITTIYIPNFIDMKNNLPKLGAIKIVTCNYSQYSSRYDKFREGIVLSAFDPKCSGGALADINIYNLHFVIGLFGKPSDVKYFANIERGIDTSGLVILQYPTFQAVCIGAKDCGAPGGVNVQGSEGYYHSTIPAFTCESYQMKLNKEEALEINKNDSKMRMKYELLAFEKMFSELDFDWYSEVSQHSLTVVETAEKARLDAGFKFEADL